LALQKRNEKELKRLEDKKKRATREIEKMERNAQILIDQREEELLQLLCNKRRSSQKNLELEREEAEFYLDSLLDSLSFSSSFLCLPSPSPLLSYAPLLLARLASLLSSFRSLSPPPSSTFLKVCLHKENEDQPLIFQDLLHLVSPQLSYVQTDLQMKELYQLVNYEKMLAVNPIGYAHQEIIGKGLSFHFQISFSPSESIQVNPPPSSSLPSWLFLQFLLFSHSPSLAFSLPMPLIFSNHPKSLRLKKARKAGNFLSASSLLSMEGLRSPSRSRGKKSRDLLFRFLLFARSVPQGTGILSLSSHSEWQSITMIASMLLILTITASNALIPGETSSLPLVPKARKEVSFSIPGTWPLILGT